MKIKNNTDKILGSAPENVVEIRRSSWCMVQLVHKKDVTDLLQQEIVYDPYKKILISFRTIACKPPVEKVFEIYNIDSKRSLFELEEALTAEGHVVTEKSVPSEVWKSTIDTPVVWKTKAPNPEWVIPKKIKLKKKTMSIKMAQTCNICHADDHSNRYCQWPKLFPDLLKKPPMTTPLRK